MVNFWTGGEAYTVKGQAAGLAIASALVTLGNPRKISLDQVKADTKGGKIRKSQSQHPDSCLWILRFWDFQRNFVYITRFYLFSVDTRSTGYKSCRASTPGTGKFCKHCNI